MCELTTCELCSSAKLEIESGRHFTCFRRQLMFLFGNLKRGPTLASRTGCASASVSIEYRLGWWWVTIGSTGVLIGGIGNGMMVGRTSLRTIFRIRPARCLVVQWHYGRPPIELCSCIFCTSKSSASEMWTLDCSVMCRHVVLENRTKMHWECECFFHRQWRTLRMHTLRWNLKVVVILDSRVPN